MISGQGLGAQLGSSASVPPQPEALEENNQPEVYKGHEGNRDQRALFFKALG